MVGDPIADMIIRIKNAGMAGLASVTLPYSKMKFEIANVLKNEGFIKSFEYEGKDKLPSQRKLVVGVLYTDRGPQATGRKISKIKGFERVSKPSRRVYFTVNDLATEKHSKGLSILSTTKGIISGRTAKEKGVGGEVLFKIW